MIKVSIVILSYNTSALLKACLQSIYTHIPHTLFEIIVVDNASSDGSREMIKKEFSNVRLILSDMNVGFASGCNLGAREAKGAYLLFLNSDALFQKDSVSPMLSVIEKDEKLGVLGGLLLNHDGSLQRSGGRFYTLPIAIRVLVGGDIAEMVQYKGSTAEKVDWVSGGFMLVRKKVFDEVQGFDQKFFMYIEDMELCYRMKKAGYEVALYPEAKIIHAGQGSSNRSFAVEHIYKGLLYFYQKHMASWEYWALKLVLLTKAVVLIGLGIVTKNRYLVKTYTRALKMV
jgi:GT2 family glycosyltransferase